MGKTELAKLLKKLSACPDAVIWSKGKNLATAWKDCNRGDWMIWLLIHTDNTITSSQLRTIAAKCAREVQHLMKDQRSIAALDVAERHANGLATDEELAAAWAAAMDAAWAAGWDAGWDAAMDAAWAKQAYIVRSIIPMIEIKQSEPV